MSATLNDPGHLSLRQELEVITADTDAEGLPRQVALIPKLSSTYRHSIRLLRERLVGRPETDGFNCHTYAFGLHGVVRRFAIMGVRPKRAFVTWLIANVLTEIEWSDCRDGDFVVYFGGQSVEHSGVWHRGRVRSKWGTAH